MTRKQRRVHAFIEGRVQGVGYRYYARERAEELGLCGWVRNVHDGRVEVLVEGEDERVSEFLEWCRGGPPSAIVRGVQVDEERPTGEFSSFVIAMGAR